MLLQKKKKKSFNWKFWLFLELWKQEDNELFFVLWKLSLRFHLAESYSTLKQTRILEKEPALQAPYGSPMLTTGISLSVRGKVFEVCGFKKQFC